jgi:hypothetical protein
MPVRIRILQGTKRGRVVKYNWNKTPFICFYILQASVLFRKFAKFPYRLES